ncbi:MAG: DUF4418 family protein [Nitrospirae bacterium]|nr:DUF4418 family protein [Nitrospirota bacterium]
MKNRVFGTVLFIVGGSVLLTPKYILPVCEFTGKSRMACTYMGVSEMFLGGIILSIAIGVFFSKSTETLRWLMFVSFISALSVILIPEAIGYCKSPSMPCNYGTVPMLRLLGGILAIISSVGVVFGSSRKPS